MKVKADIKILLFNVVFFLYIVSATSYEYMSDRKSIASVLVYALFGVGIVYILFNKKIHFDMFSVFKILLCIDVALMYIYAPSKPAIRTVWGVTTVTALCIITGAFAYDKPKLVRVLWWANIAGAFVMTVETVRAYGGIGMMFDYLDYDKQGRIGSLITNVNSMGFIFSNAFVCCIMMILSKETKLKWIKIPMVALMAVFGIMSLLTGSRQAVIFVILGIITTALYYMRNLTVKRKLLTLVFFAALLVTAVTVIRNVPAFGTVKERMEELFDILNGGSSATASDGNRIRMINEGFDKFLESPLFGNGTSYTYEMFGAYAHNNFIELLVNYGLVGFLLYYIPYFFVLPGVIRIARKGDLYAIYFAVFIIIELILSVVNVHYYMRPVQITIMMAYKYVLSVNDAEAISAGYHEVKNKSAGGKIWAEQNR